MKIYTSEVSQFGRTLLICNKEVTFDKVGCAEVEDSQGKELINYAPDWYSKDKKELKKEVKKLDEDTLMKNFEIEELQGKIEQLRKMDESRVSALKAKESENDQIREEMGKVVELKTALETELANKEEIWNKEKEQLEYKFELALLTEEELIDMCGKLGIDLNKYKEPAKKAKKGEEDQEKEPRLTIDKKGLIELIINAAE